MTEKNKVEIILSLEGTLKTSFEAIKEKLGIKNNTEVLRYAVRQTYNELFGDKKDV